MIKKHFKIGFIGTGNIANVHAESVRALKQLHLHSVYDPNPQAMERFAKKYDAKPRTLEDMLSDPAIDAIHILTPPDTHAQLLVKCANSGKALFVEKPIATTTDDIQALKTLQETNKSFIGVNQNMCFHPAFVELRRALAEGKHGALRQVEVTFRPPLRQLSAQQFSHWMFRSSLNLLLEQAVHPISQLLAMVGKPDNLRALPTDFLKINSDNSVCTTFSAALSCGKVSATFNFGVGALYPTWKISAYCDDAIIEADMITGICAVQGRSAFIDPVDHALSVRKTSKSRTSKARQHLVAYAKAIAGFGARSDTFYLGIKNSVEHFYGALSGDHPLLTDVDFGLNAVQVCYDMNAELAKFEPKKVDLPFALTPGANTPDPRKTVCLLGASGFIGRSLTENLVKRGFRVRAVARTITNLSDIFQHPQVELVRGDVKSIDSLRSVIDGCTYVINLAHGGGGANYEEIKKALVDSAVLVAKVCIEKGVKRIIHTGSIAGLYLGDASETITGGTKPDPQPDVRGDYARAKALADHEFIETCKAGAIDFVVLRPGVVVGQGTHPLHAGLGFFNNEGHVVGWSDGTHPIPFVLVDDVADATARCIEAPNASGKCYNISGDVKMSVRQYLDALNKTTGRSVMYHGKSPRILWVEDVVKNIIKRVGGKKAPFADIRDFRSRAMFAQLDCSDLKTDTGWKPVSDPVQFAKAIFG